MQPGNGTEGSGVNTSTIPSATRDTLDKLCIWEEGNSLI